MRIHSAPITLHCVVLHCNRTEDLGNRKSDIGTWTMRHLTWTMRHMTWTMEHLTWTWTMGQDECVGLLQYNVLGKPTVLE